MGIVKSWMMAGRIIRFARKKKGLTIAQFSQEVQISRELKTTGEKKERYSPSLFSHLEMGVRKPTPELLLSIFNVLDFSDQQKFALIALYASDQSSPYNVRIDGEGYIQLQSDRSLYSFFEAFYFDLEKLLADYCLPFSLQYDKVSGRVDLVTISHED